MPEGPELHVASSFINRVCSERVFCGKVVKSAVSTKNPDVPWSEKQYKISAISRGKEVRLTLQTVITDDLQKGKSLDILIRFGMSGKFKFSKLDEMHKHAHLNFFTKDEHMVLSFVDPRRFGKWEIGAKWGKDRGPCILQEYAAFRENVLHNLDNAAFNRPICEALLNQNYFNGIGNYLRADILFRARIAPFKQAREVLEPLLKQDNIGVLKTEQPDVLQLCNILPMEVITLDGGPGYSAETSSDGSSEAFVNWLQCYSNPKMKNLVDSNKRTIWFSGAAGPMTPKEGKMRSRKSKTRLNKRKHEHEDDESTPKKAKFSKPTRTQLDKLKTENENMVKTEDGQSTKILESSNIKSENRKRKIVSDIKLDKKHINKSKSVRLTTTSTRQQETPKTPRSVATKLKATRRSTRLLKS